MNTGTTKNTKTNYLLGFSRIVTGLLFIFSGFIKANDPTGFGYKLEEYFHVFGTHFLNEHSINIAIVVCGIEILLGALLLLGFRARIVAWGLLLLILFFTFLTFYSAFFEVVTSCGCFGDAIPLTPWQSFGKDLVLLALILIIFRYRKQIRPVTNSSFTRSVITFGLIILSFGIGIYTVNFSPFIDFLPYKKGNNIPKLMSIPEGEVGDVYEIIYTLKNKTTGEEKKVSDKIYLDEEYWKDENWEIVGEPESRLAQKGYQVPISDLLITDANGDDYTQEIIENPYYNLVVVSWDLTTANVDALRDINALVMNAAESYNIRSVLLTSSSTQVAETLSDELDLLMEVFYADAVPLKSMVRANPGILLMQNGTVIEKWHYHTLPSFDTLDSMYFSKAYQDE